MTNRLKSLFAILFALTTLGTMAQQVPLSGLYYQNKFLVNPASAGEQDALVAFFNHRRQWVGIEGAPVTNIISIHSPIGNGNQAIGGNVSVDKTHVLQRTTGSLAYSQRFNFNKSGDHYIAIGAGVGLIDNRIDVSDLVGEDPSEVILAADQINGTTFNVDAGLKYKFKGLDFGVSVPQVLETKIAYDDYESDRFLELKRHFNAYLAYNFHIKEDVWMVEPSVFFRYLINGQPQYDGNIFVNWKNTVWLGVTGRSYVGIIPSLGIRIAESFGVQYSYEIATTGIGTQSDGTHEVMLSYRLGGNNKDKEQDEELERLAKEQEEILNQIDSLYAVKAEKSDVEELQANVDEKIDDLEGQLSDLSGKMVGYDDRLNEFQSELESQSARIDSKVDTNSIRELLTRIRVSKDSKSGETVIDEVALEQGYYVVIESFRKQENALRYIKGFNDRSDRAIIVHNKARGWYYCYTKKYDNLKESLGAMRKIREQGFEDAWVHIYKP